MPAIDPTAIILTGILSGLGAGMVTGFVCFVAMRQDVKWLKESVAELRALFFKYVQDNPHSKG